MLYALLINIRFGDLGQRGLHMLKSKASFTNPKGAHKGKVG